MWPYRGPLGGWGGTRVVSSDMAITVKVFFDVVKTNPRARRKRYRVIRREERRPAAYWVATNGGYFIAHPSIIEQIKEQQP